MAVDHGTAITINGKILLVGGRSSGQFIDKVFEYDPIADLWSEKSSMSIPRSGVGFLFRMERFGQLAVKSGSVHRNGGNL